MKALDTNVLVRVIARDDEQQLRIADSLLQADEVLILPTVLLETEWVLRSRYRLDRSHIAAGLARVCGLKHARVPHGAAIAAAILRYAQGQDFGDALHVALAGEFGAAHFVTFDKGVTAAPGVAVETLVSSGPQDE